MFITFYTLKKTIVAHIPPLIYVEKQGNRLTILFNLSKLQLNSMFKCLINFN